jgi:hypothetical protein
VKVAVSVQMSRTSCDRECSCFPASSSSCTMIEIAGRLFAWRSHESDVSEHSEK